MHTRKLALFAALAIAGGTTAAFAPSAAAQVSIGVTIGTPPPPLRYEVVPAPRPGYVWAPGYWSWGGSGYVWIGGTWYQDRPGYVYVRPRWVNDHGRWRMDRAYWGRDPHWRGRHDDDRHDGWYNRHGDDDDQGNRHRGRGDGHRGHRD